MTEGNTSLSDVLNAIQNGVAATNNLAQLLSQATVNSSSLQVGISSTIFGTVTTINTSIGLTGGPITTTGTLAVSLTKLTNTISSDVSLTNTSSFFDGPSVAQGTSGVWFASGNVTVIDTGVAATVSVKLWDGTTVIDSGQTRTAAANLASVVSLSGFITNPAGNIKISAQDLSATTGLIKLNQSGVGKDSTITVMRIG